MIGKLLALLAAFGAGVGGTLLTQKARRAQASAQKETDTEPELLEDTEVPEKEAEPLAQTEPVQSEEERVKQILLDTLKSFEVDVCEEVICQRGPTVTRYIFRPQPGVSARSILELEGDFSLNVQANVRVECPIPGKCAFAVEVPNKERKTVYLSELLRSEQFQSATGALEVPLGLTAGGALQTCDLAKMPHLLVAGTTGSGKSVCIHTMLVSLITKYSPADVRLVLIDPKQVEFSAYAKLPHLYVPILTDAKRTTAALACLREEMERRFSLLREAGARNVASYNEAVKNDPARERLPYIVIVIDELADLMLCGGSELEGYLCMIAQKARAAGLHLIVGTQRPSVDVITGVLKANIPSRIACAVRSVEDSLVLLDTEGAQTLVGRGDMLYQTVGNGGHPVRVQGAFVSESEIEQAVSAAKGRYGAVQYNKAFVEQIDVEIARMMQSACELEDEETEEKQARGEDEKFEEAVRLIVRVGKASTSLLQRHLGVGYGRALRMIDRMEELGFVTPREGNTARGVLPAALAYAEELASTESTTEDELV
ncbi:MAG: DNA translocase FtsK [Ruminococcaceae bacterium]|nr:DNA translocase FtsK [Oscillospiraceae bacterium]